MSLNCGGGAFSPAAPMRIILNYLQIINVRKQGISAAIK